MSPHQVKHDSLAVLFEREQHISLTLTKQMHSLIQAQSHTFVEIDNEIIYTAILISSTDMRGSRQGDRGLGPSPLKNHKNIGFLSIIGLDYPEKLQLCQGSIQCWAIIGTPVKRHLNGVSLTG